MTTASYQSLPVHQPKISVSTSQGTYIFQTDEITRLQASSNYTFIHFTNRKPLLISKVLKSYEELLGPVGFIRTHQSHLVNTQYIRFLDRQGTLEMSDASKVEVSRSKRKSVLAALRNAGTPVVASETQAAFVPGAR